MVLRVHSLESFGTLDGPGVRFVIFLQGCPLRCRYCHNPDTWAVAGGMAMETEEIMVRIRSCKNFLRNGGVTISGGEPLLQSHELVELLNACRQEGFHSAIDTAGSLPLEETSEAIDAADMLLLDIKSLEDTIRRALTGHGNEMALATLDYCEKKNKSVWIRHVVVPGFTLNDDALRRLGTFLASYRCIKRAELLAYHKMGQKKYEALGIMDPLADTPELDAKDFVRAQKIFIDALKKNSK